MPTQTIYCQDALTLTEEYVKHFDVQIADLPYREHVHANATSQSKKRGTRKRDLGFESLTNQLRERAALWSSYVKRWTIFYSDVEDSHLLREAAEENGTEYIRTMPWVRWSMPQLSGDRPPQGFEHILCLHVKGKKHWNGPGNLTHFEHRALRGEEKHKCEKPLDQALDIVSFFSDPGEWVFDPCAGRGTIGVACRLLGRNYAGFEINPEWADKGQRRLLGDPEDIRRIVRWLEKDSEPVEPTTARNPDRYCMPSPDNDRRKEARARDKEAVRKGIYL